VLPRISIDVIGQEIAPAIWGKGAGAKRASRRGRRLGPRTLAAV